MVYRNKTYVCFDGDSDIRYYRLMQAWHQSDNTSFTLYNAHDLNTARDTSLTESIRRRLRERLLNTKVFVVLVGERTRYLTRFVRWEMEQALAMALPIIAVNLNGLRAMDPNRCPPTIRDVLAVHVSFNAAILQYALEHWPDSHRQHRQRGESGPFFYKASVYQALRI